MDNYSENLEEVITNNDENNNSKGVQQEVCVTTEEEKSDFKKVSTWLWIVGSAIMLAILIFIGVVLLKMVDNKSESNTGLTSKPIIGENIEGETEKVVEGEQDLEEKYTFVHNMTNTVIIAEDGKIWVKGEVSNSTIDKALEMFNGVDDKVVKYLNQWKEGDFENSVDFHNYVWGSSYLNGNIGKAKSLNNEAIEKIKKELGK